MRFAALVLGSFAIAMSGCGPGAAPPSTLPEKSEAEISQMKTDHAANAKKNPNAKPKSKADLNSAHVGK
jgi:hypothetical protein